MKTPKRKKTRKKGAMSAPKIPTQRITVTYLDGTTKKGFLVHGVTYVYG